MLSPLDLQGKRITAKRKKYDKADMDEYLDFVFENYKALYDEHLETQKRLKEADEKIAYYRSIESTMQKALVLAEKTSTRIQGFLCQYSQLDNQLSKGIVQMS